MIIETLTVGPLMTNCHIFACEASREAAIIDPGGEARRIARRVEDMSLDVKWIIDTHGHADHVGAQAALKARFPAAAIAIHEADAACLTDAGKNLSALLNAPVTSPPADRVLRDGDEIAVGRHTLKVLHVPGHTPGGIALYVDNPGDDAAPVVFCGDTLFAGSIGRADFPGGAMDELLEAIRARLLTLPSNTLVYTGHGEPTTIEQETRGNPFLT